MWALSFLLATSLLPSALSFTFNASTPTQCSPFTLSWDGGSPPFQFLLVPTNTINAGRILNITIPSGLQQPYSYTFDLNEPSGLQFLATMYDSTGFGSGGTTPALTVGSSDNSSCLDNNLLYDFTFSISPEDNPAQCSNQHVEWLANATDPVSLFGLIPSGSAWQIPLPSDTNTNSLDWQVDIAQSTQYLLVMSDNGQYRTGGSSPLITVASGSDSCMNSTSPKSGGTSSGTSSASAAGETVSGVGGSSSGGSSNPSSSGSSSSGGSKTGAIVGGTVGGVAFLLLLGLLLICCVRRRARSRRDSETDPVIKSYGVGATTTEKRRTAPLDLLSGGRHPHRQTSDDSEAAGAGTGGAEYQPSPFRYPSPPQTTTAGLSGGINQNQPNTLSMAGAGVSEKNGRNGPMTPTTTTTTTTHPHPPFAQHDSSRPSMDSDMTASELANSGHTAATAPTSASAGVQPPSAWSEGEATAGHTPQRNSSISKPPTTSAAGAAVGQMNASPGSGNRPLPGVPAPPGPGARFVQHEDSGEVVDLPPRYDQLRARNPDQ